MNEKTNSNNTLRDVYGDLGHSRRNQTRLHLQLRHDNNNVGRIERELQRQRLGNRPHNRACLWRNPMVRAFVGVQTLVLIVYIVKIFA